MMVQRTGLTVIGRVVAISCLLLVGGMQAKQFLLDTIEAVVYGPTGPRVITKWDLARPPLGGPPPSLDDVILEYLIFDDSQKLKISPSEADVDRILDMVRQQNEMTMPQLRKVVKESGYAWEEMRERFGRMQVVSQMMDYRVRSNVIVPRRKIVEYYEEHPEVQEARLVMRKVFIPAKENKSEEQQLKELKSRLAKKKARDALSWGDSFTIAASDVADSKRFFFNLKVGQVSKPMRVSNGFELYQLMERHEKQTRTLDERYAEISEKLKEPVFERLFEEYKKKLLDEASVLRLS